MTHIEGKFEVKTAALPFENSGGDESLGRRSLDKRYFGELDAVAIGQMLSMVTAVKGSAGYVAIERVTGKLGGRQGSFALQHGSTMHKGAPRQSIQVVPDSGTGELTGLSGQMTIRIEAGVHYYEFDYTLE